MRKKKNKTQKNYNIQTLYMYNIQAVLSNIRDKKPKQSKKRNLKDCIMLRESICVHVFRMYRQSVMHSSPPSPFAPFIYPFVSIFALQHNRFSIAAESFNLTAVLKPTLHTHTQAENRTHTHTNTHLYTQSCRRRMLESQKKVNNK